MYIPDPIELMEASIDRLCEKFDEKHCMSCGIETDEFFPLNSTPTALAVCKKCVDKES